VNYSHTTLAAFSAALGRVHATRGRAPGPVSALPAEQSSPQDMAFLVALLENQRTRAAQPGPSATSPERGEEIVARFGRLRRRGLTARECEVVGWIAQGKRDAEIATIFGCAPKTVGKHVEHLLAKLGAETRLAAARTAVEWLRHANSEPVPPDVHP